MAARPISTSTVSFGLVSLPVKLYSTGQSSAKVRFNWINRDSGARVKYQYVDSPERGTGRPRKPGEGLRVRQEPICHLRARRAEGDRGPGDRDD